MLINKINNNKYNIFCQNISSNSIIKYGTLDKNHKMKIEYFNNKSNNLSKLYKDLEKLKIKYDKVDNYDVNKTENIDLDITDTINESIILKNIFANKKKKNQSLINDKIILRKSIIKDKIDKIENQINLINNYTEELEYYSDTIDILLNYYNNINDDKSILFDNYMKIVNNISIKNEKKNLSNICNICNIEKNIKQIDKTLICINCGDVNNIIFDSDKINIKENQEALYKRSNHLCELLNQFQGKESTEIPQNIIDDILKELKKIRFYDLNNIDSKILKKIL